MSERTSRARARAREAMGMEIGIETLREGEGIRERRRAVFERERREKKGARRNR